MRFLVGLILLSLAIGLGAGAEEKRPNTLTPTQISDGWLLLFDGETTFGWKPQGEAKWRVEDGAVVADGGGAGTLSTTTEFANFDLKAELWVDARAESGITAREAADAPRSEAKLALSGAKKPTGRWVEITVGAIGQKVFYQRADTHSTYDVMMGAAPRGVVTLHYGGTGVAKFRNIRLRPTTLEKIFNGKDLTGWHIMPNKKSVIIVTPEGWLNIKGGSGDVQTDRQWGDFTLQLECISNGSHCNSGIFYRSNLNEFEMGYEDQIRNQWEGDDRTKPVDAGTGAIYRRQAARKVVSSDHEWFTMTLIAHGLHFGSWVNGYMVADFTDTRPPDETNARKGARTKPGCLSLQGHDADGDLSFRNIRVAEMPSAHP